ncbi:coiled-coil domain-containing protein 138-like isoform X2 [Rhopilema esculentum]|uniref:coiled-coil domain-containing protein 138-like isoform X2 n=1 Tax=Rhopilema esculentum TaxID=499914 RepID=UPI0031D84DD3
MSNQRWTYREEEAYGPIADVEEILSNKEKRHYSRALKEMHELVKLESLRMHTSRSDSESETKSQLYDDEISDAYLSGLSAKSIHYRKANHDYGQKPSKKIEVAAGKRQKKIYLELCDISKGLQAENERLKKWDADLQQEQKQTDLLKRKIQQYEDSLDQLIDNESEKRCKEFQKAFEDRMLETTEESKRTKLSFKIMKQANDSLKKQNSQLEEDNRKLEEKLSSFNNRISNLQRKNEILKKEVNDSRTLELTKQNNEKLETSIEKKLKQTKVELDSLSETLGICLDWVAESQLKQHVKTLITNETNEVAENDIAIEIASEKAFKIVQPIPSFLDHISNSASKLSFLHFVFWSLLLAEYTQKRKSGVPLAAYRRIGEKLFKSQIPQADSSDKKLAVKKSDQSVYSRMNDAKIRILSEFIILKTTSQADILAKVLEELKSDTRSEEGKEIFIHFHGAAVLLSFLGGKHKGLLHLSVDVLMQITVESPFMGQFLESLSNQLWIKTFYDLFQRRSVENAVLEKLSIVLQRLSKIKSNQKYFDNVQFSKLIRELAANLDVERPFLALNLRSILLNLSAKAPGVNVKKKQPES